MKRKFGMVSACLFFLLACSSLGSDEDLSLNEMNTNSISAELWLENCRELISQKDSQNNQRTFFAELPNEDLNVEIVLDGANEVSKVNVSLSANLSSTLYFDYDHLSFSEAKLEGETFLISAYADGKPYAHALANGENPSDGQIVSTKLKETTLRSIVSLAKSYSQKEKKAAYNVRISDKEASIREAVELQKDYTAVVNVKKGEKIDINLSCDEPHVYFTISPSIGSDMERKFWRGPAPFTGDIHIRVFAAEEIRNGNFKLDIRRL